MKFGKLTNEDEALLSAAADEVISQASASHSRVKNPSDAT
jgi:hypothetical protein